MNEKTMWILMILVFILLLSICTTGLSIVGSFSGLCCSLAGYFLCCYENKR